MTLREFYDMLGGDYAGTLGRMMKEDRMKKYLLRLPDSKDYTDCLNAFEAKDYDLAFRASHNLKGMALNLGLTKLAESSSELCESVRHGAPAGDVSDLIEKMKADYEETILAIQVNLA